MEAAAAWKATGECVVGFATCGRRDAPLPAGLQRLPGPVLVVAARYATSPLGPYLELAVLEPVRVGLHVGTCATMMVVDSAESRDAGRIRWGFPKELGSLHWSSEDDAVSLEWEERAMVVRSQPCGPAFPALVPFRSLQSRADEPVRIDGVLRGPARFSRMEITVGSEDPLASLAGRHRGTAVARASLTMGQARPLASHR